MSMRHAMPSLAITLVLSTLMSRLYLRLYCHSPHLPKNQLLGSLEPGAKRTNYCVFYAGKSRLVTFIRLLTFHLDSFVGSTNALDPTDLKSGRVRPLGPGGNRRLCVRGIFAFDLCASAATRMPYVQCLTSRKRDWA